MVVLMWNPAISNVKEDYFIKWCEVAKKFGPAAIDVGWSVWDYKDVKPGDTFVLVKVGEPLTGIVMAGNVRSYPYQDEDWSGHGRITHYVDLSVTMILNPYEGHIIPTSVLQEVAPDFDWSGGHSGRILAEKDATAVQRLIQDVP